MNEYLQDEREIKGYVEIEYSEIKDTVSHGTTTYPAIAPISEFDNYDNKKISQNYASLENDYFLLDGSFVLPYKPDNEEIYYNKNSGYISQNIASDENNSYVINRTGGTSPYFLTNGITIYLKDNIPENIKITVTHPLGYETENLIYEIENNIKDIITIKFDYLIYILNLEIVFSNFEYEDRRLRISKIDYGLSNVLKDNSLIDFNIIENIGELNLEFPSNQLTVNLYDEYDDFNINNPQGYTDLLNQNLEVKVKPYIGILTEKNGIVYNEELATFYLNSWNNNNKQITLNCVDYLEKLKSTPSVTRIGCSANYGNNDNKLMLENFDVTMENEVNIEYDDFVNFDDGINGKFYYDDNYVTTVNIFDYLTQFMIWVWGLIYCKDKILIIPRENTEIYNKTLTLENSLLEEPIYTLNEPIKNINISKYSGEQQEKLATEVFYGDYYYNSSLTDDIIVNFKTKCDVRAEFGTYENTWEGITSINLSSWAIGLYSSGTISIYITGFYTSSESSLYNKEINNIGKTIQISNKFFKKYDGNSGSYAESLDNMCNNLCNKIINENKKYNIKFNYSGDPTIIPNMIVPIETKYGNKEIKVLKHTLTFNGGLTGSIEGVGD